MSNGERRMPLMGAGRLDGIGHRIIKMPPEVRVLVSDCRVTRVSLADISNSGLVHGTCAKLVGFMYNLGPLYIRAQFLGPIQSHKYRPMGVPSWSNWAVTWAKGFYIEARPNFPISYMVSYVAGFWQKRIGPKAKTWVTMGW